MGFYFIDAIASIMFVVAVLIYLIGAIRWVIKRVKNEGDK